MSKAKRQGTYHEGTIVRRLNDAGHRAERLALAGVHDRGDIRADIHGVEVIIEAKSAQTITLHSVLAGVRKKAGTKPALVWWRRVVKTEGKKVRQPVAGQRELVAMDPTDLLKIIQAAYAAGQQASELEEPAAS